MAVSKKAYPVLAPWTIDQVADQFRHVFQDIGLMADWVDSFSVVQAGQTHHYRVLKVVYDASKTYGQMHYVFLFVPEGSALFGTPADAGVHVTLCAFWDSVTHNPGGTAKLDFILPTDFKTRSSYGSYSDYMWRRLCVLNDSSTVTLYTYTSSIDPDYSWVFIKSGTTEELFHISPASTQLAPWINLNEVCYHGLYTTVAETSNSAGLIQFRSYGAMRRSFYGGGLCRLSGAPTDISIGPLMLMWNRTHRFGATGATDNSNSYSATWINSDCIWLPIGLSIANNAITADRTPVFTDLPMSFYILNNPPVDFGIAFHYENRTMERQDVFQVTPGVEEWEILDRANNTYADVGEGASPLFLALVTGNPSS